MHSPYLKLSSNQRVAISFCWDSWLDIIITATMWCKCGCLVASPTLFYAERTSWKGSSYEPNELPLDPPLL